MAQRGLQTLPLVVRRLQVVRTCEVTPRMVRVTVTGEQLDAFEHPAGPQPAFASPAFDDHVKIVFAPASDIEAALPVQLSHGIEWPASSTRITRDYTPRRFDPETLELDLDFVLGHDGPASLWAIEARPGDPLWIVGPKSSTVLPDDLDWIMLLGDETALPAIARFLEERPTNAPARIVVTVSTTQAQLELATRPDDEVTWIVAPAHDGSALQSAVLDSPMPEGTGYLWAAAESRILLPIRRHATRELQLPKSHLNITGYWHHRTADDHGHDHQDASGAASWFATRAALRLGLLDAVAREGSEEEVAQRVGVPTAQLAPLLGVLEEAGLVGRDVDSGLHLGDSGEALLGDEHSRESYEGLEADALLSLASLDVALAEDLSGWQAHYGRTLRETARSSADHYAELIEEAQALGFVITALATDSAWATLERIGLTGPGALSVAAAFHDRHLPAELVVMEEPAPLSALRAEGAEIAVSWHEGLAPCDALILALALEHRTDAESVDLLRSLRKVTSSVTVVERVRADLLGARGADHALLRLTATGSGPRDAERVIQLAEEAGWTAEAGSVLGWGFETLVLRSVQRPSAP